MLGVLVWKAARLRRRRARPGVDVVHRLVAARRRRAHVRSASCCRRCAGRRCSPPSVCRSHLGHLLNYYLAGQFVSNVLPTTIGGDVLRVSRLSRENGEPPASFASVVLERLTGWLVLPAADLHRLRHQPRARPPRHRHEGRPRPRHRHPRAARRRAGARRLAPVRRPLRRRRGLAAVRRRRAPRARPAAPPPGRRGQRARRRLRLPARPRARRPVRRQGGRHGRRGRTHGAARLLPRRRHRPGAARRHLGARHPRRCVRAVPRTRSACPTSRRSPSACCSTC